MADEEKTDQSGIDDLVNELAALNSGADEPAKTASPPATKAEPAASDGLATAEDIEALLNATTTDTSDDSGLATEDDIEALLAEATSDSAPETAPEIVSKSDIDALLQQASEETPAAVNAAGKGLAGSSLQAFEMPSFEEGAAESSVNKIDLIKDVNLSVRVELGRRKMYIEEILKLGAGSVVELEKLAGDPLDILVNDRLVARGEVLILNDNFCIRVTEIIKSGENEA